MLNISTSDEDDDDDDDDVAPDPAEDRKARFTWDDDGSLVLEEEGKDDA